MKKLTEAFNSVTVGKGETFEIELSSNPGTGYSWETVVLSGKARLLKSEIAPACAPMSAGGPAVERFTFKAEETGSVEIRADYKRPWEKKAPAQSQSFKITVQ